MPDNKISYTALVHQVVQQSPEPLTVDEIMERVAAMAPITTKDPKGTIRNAINASRVIVAVGDKRYGWKPRVINGSTLRMELGEKDLAAQRLSYSEEVRDALYPAFFGSSHWGDRESVHVFLAHGSETRMMLEHGVGSSWGTACTPELWAWLTAHNPSPGDALLLSVLDGEARRYGLTFEARAARDDAAIQERNQSIAAATLRYIRGRRSSMSWDITNHLLVTGAYRHPVAPDPLSEIFDPEIWQPVLDEEGDPDDWPLIDGSDAIGWAYEIGQAVDQLAGREKLLMELLGADFEAPAFPVALPSVDGIFIEDDEPYDAQEPPEPWPRSFDKPVATVLLRVTHREFRQVSRDILIAADQSLHDLHLAIQEAYRWDNDHLYSFFMSGKAWDSRTEIGSPWSDSRRYADEVKLSSLKLRKGRKFLYLFDYGDNHEFDVEVLELNAEGAPGTYPRTVGKKGRAPKQYYSY